MKYYGGIDLHSTNNVQVLLDETGKLIYSKKLPNDLDLIIEELKSYEGIESLVVESTYNWYWLVDGLQEAGYTLQLANPNAIRQYNGIKHTDDKSDAHWLAELNRLGIVSKGYIYPKADRGVRDLLRKRGQLVQERTAHILSLQTLIERSTSKRLSGNQIKQLTAQKFKEYLSDENIYLSGLSHINMLGYLDENIDTLERAVSEQMKLRGAYKKLTAMDGIGNILALTIMLETGDISRFAHVGNYSSYCRCVGSQRLSNGKKKGVNNTKNGNKYLSWAFMEAANFAIRYNEVIKKYYQKKLSKTNRVIALKTVAHKLARACYYVLRDKVDFDVHKAFMS